MAADETAIEGTAVPALKKHIAQLDCEIEMFCDDTRDAIKGHVFEAEIPGFVNGANGLEEKILNSVRAWSTDGRNVKAPSQVITYVSAHDNWTLWDKLEKTISDEEERISINKMAAANVYDLLREICFSYQEKNLQERKMGLRIHIMHRLS